MLQNSVVISDYQYFNGAVIFQQAEQWARLCEVPNTDSIALDFEITAVSSLDNYIIEVWVNDNLETTIETSGIGSKFGRVRAYFLGNYGAELDERYKFYLKSLTANTISTKIKITFGNGLTETYLENIDTSIVSSNKLDLDSFIPDIKIIDFLKGIFNQFNLTCYQTAENKYNIITLEEWYRTGSIYDISEYTDVTSIDINRISLPKATRFNYQKSDSFVNRIFAANNGREYGMTGVNWTFDGGEYVIDLPFEQLKFLSQPNNLIPLGYSLKSDVIPPVLTTDLKEYIPKPILLYKYGLSNIDVGGHRCRMTDGTNTRNFSQAMVFGQDTVYGTADISLNFSTDESEYLKSGEMLYNAYSMYYQSYISNLYAINQRMITIKTNLPLSLLTTLKLNDRLIIKGKRYIINDYQADLTSGDVSFNLILDFRDLTTYGWAEDAETFPPDEVG